MDVDDVRRHLAGAVDALRQALPTRPAAVLAAPAKDQDRGEALPVEPAKDDIFLYRLSVFSTTTPSWERAPAIEVTVVAVDKAKKVVTLKSAETNKPVNDPTTHKVAVVPWTELTPVILIAANTPLESR
jgi:hypothetical protein